MIAARTLIVAGVAAAFLPGMSLAQDTINQGYLVDQNFNVVMAVGNTVCVRTSDWTPARAAAAKACQQCTPDLCVKPVALGQSAPARAATPSSSPPPRKEPGKLLPQKINFSADALFDFDKAVLKPEGKAMLDELARLLNGAQYEVIGATGHADRFGSNQYNQKLSERRANAVKDYLASRDIPANRINATGKGETQPVTKAGDCLGRKSAKVIACLQPDRRVDVEVTGSK
jgi:OmpA-OmpF porin, OOP family